MARGRLARRNDVMVRLPEGHSASRRVAGFLRAGLLVAAVPLVVLPALASSPLLPQWVPPPPRAAGTDPALPPPRAALAGLPVPRAVTAAGGCGWTASPPAMYRHVIWIWFENKHLDEVIGSRNAPYMTALARTRCSYGTRWLDNVLDTPSLPNYIAASAGANCDSLTLHTRTPSGDRCITRNDAPAASCQDVKCAGTIGIVSIFEQLENAGKTWKAYMESMPENCSTANPSGSYYVKHNPAPYFSRLRIPGRFGGDTCSQHNVPFPTTRCTGLVCVIPPGPNRLADDLATGRLPTLSVISPNICNDMHDRCSGYSSSVANGDDWLAAWMPRILASPNYLAGNTAVFIMWDEGVFGQPQPGIVVAPSVTPGHVVGATINIVSALRATEDMLGLGHLGCATGRQGDGSRCPAGSTANLRGLFGI